MGQYINQDSKGTPLPATGKAATLIQDGATKLSTPPNTYRENLVYVVENGFFDAAAYAYSEREFEYFRDLQKSGRDTRPFTWLVCTDLQIAQAR